MSEFSSLCSSAAQTFQHGDRVGQLAHHCSLPVAELSWDAGSSCLLEQPYSRLCGCLLCFPQFGCTQNSMSKYALIAHITLKFSSETLLSSTGHDYELRLAAIAASYCWLSILEPNLCSSEEDAHQEPSTTASLFWINKTCSSFLKSVIFSV